MEVHNVDGEEKKAPFFRLSQGTADTEEVQVITQGNWAISFLETEVRHDGKLCWHREKIIYLHTTGSDERDVYGGSRVRETFKRKPENE